MTEKKSLLHEDRYYPENKIHGIHLARPTGNVDEEHPQYIEVTMQRDVVMYARPCYAFGLISAPSPSWLKKYKDSIFVVIAYDNSEPAYPVWLGFTYVDGKETDLEDFPEVAVFRRSNFDIVINDKQGYLKFRAFDANGDTVNSMTLSQTGVLLGSETATSPAVLGDMLNNFLGQLLDAISALTVNAAGVPTTPPINLAQFQELQTQLPQLISQIVKLK